MSDPRHRGSPWPWAVSILVHAVLLALLVHGVQVAKVTSPDSGQAETIEAMVVDPAVQDNVRQQQSAPSVPEQAAIPDAGAELARVQAEAEARRRAEEAARQQEENARREILQHQEQAERERSEAIARQEAVRNEVEARQREQQEARRQEFLKKKAEAEAKELAERQRKAEKAAQVKRQAEEAARREQLRAKAAAEAESRRKAEADRREAESQLRQLAEETGRQEALASDIKAEQQTKARDEASEAEAQAWVSRHFGPRVEQAWLKPSTAARGMSCRIQVMLQADGNVSSAEADCQGGDVRFEHSAEAAVRKASPFPMPSDPQVARQLLGQAVTFRFTPD